MVSLACLKICFRPTATVLFFFISRSPLHCALSASILGSVSHPVGDRPSHPICEVRLSESGKVKEFLLRKAHFAGHGHATLQSLLRLAQMANLLRRAQKKRILCQL